MTTVSPQPAVAQDLDGIALQIVDAIVAGDGASLRHALRELRAGERTGAVEAHIATVVWALERLPSPADAELVAPGTQAARFLAELRQGSRGGGELQAALAVGETQVSRTGRKLLDAGLVTRRKLGRRVLWDLTPRGRAAAPSPPPVGDGVDWWREVIRNAWRAPGHDSGDPVGDRILDAALELHIDQGIVETTWQDIAGAAGVPVTEVDARFPSLDELVPACGGLAFGRLRLPPPEEAAELFAGQGDEERVRTLVATLFAVYERGSRTLRALRRESERLPVVAHGRAAFEEARDALIAAAVDAESVPLVRALTTLDCWEGFRAGGVPDDAVAELIATARAAAVGT